MSRRAINAFGSIVIILIVGALLAWAGSDGSNDLGPLPLFAWCAIVAFAINAIAFIPSFLQQTETFFDLTGSITYITVTILAISFATDLDLRAGLVAAMVILWAARLGSFLFRRIRADGKDGRFDKIKVHFPSLLMTWLLQGLWVLLTAAAALAIITRTERESFGVFAVVGALVWVIGFGIEVIADNQKSAFKADPANAGRFITTGLWSWSRHPNYFGEITLWAGIAIMAIPVLSGWAWATLISPFFVFFLLNFVSGVPMLERRSDKRWGDEPEYQAYKAATSVLVPLPPRASKVTAS
ncbi:MAG: DUF1295 domain-containing protein [Actinomycetota bacterium]